MANNEWLDSMLNNKISKEAMESQGTDKQDHFERKVKAHDWINGVSALDPIAVEAEYQEKLKQEAMILGKTAALDDVIADGVTPEEVVNKDYKRDVASLSDYALAELLAEARGHEKQNTSEMYYELKEKAKAEVASSREKAEKALLDTIPNHTMLDWQKAFKAFTKDAVPAEAKEKDLYKSDVPDAPHKFDSPSEEKFKVPADQEKAIPGNGREADERKEVTQEAGVLQEDITKGLGKDASKKVADKVKSHPADDKGNIAMPEGKKSAGDKPVESVEESTLLSSPKEVGDKSDQAAEDNSPEKGDKAKDIESVNKKAHCGHCGSEEKKADASDPAHDEATREQFKQMVDGAGEEIILDLLMRYMPVEEMKGLINDLSDFGSDVTPEPEHYEHAGVPMAVSNLKKHLIKKAAGCPVCGSEGKDLKNGQKENMSCEACSLTYARANLHTGEIKSHASKAEVIKKVAEVTSPWVVKKDEQGNEVIARVGDEDKTVKESEEDILKGTIKSAAAPAPAPVADKDEDKVPADDAPKAEDAAPAPVAPAAVVAPAAPAVAPAAAAVVPPAPAASTGDTTSPTRTNTETGGSSPGGASTGGVGSGIGGAGTGGAATGGASTGGAGTVNVTLSGNSGTGSNSDGGKETPVTINISNVGGTTDAGDVASGDGPGSEGEGGSGEGSGGGGGGASPDEPRNFSTSKKDEKKDESDSSMFDADDDADKAPTDAAPAAPAPDENKAPLTPLNSAASWIRDLLK